MMRSPEFYIALAAFVGFFVVAYCALIAAIDRMEERGDA